VTIDKLVEDLGFLYFPSPNGFDHLIQTSIIDRQGRLNAQVYGMNFETPLLIEPLKRLVFSSEDKGLLRQVTDKIRLFCTVYDPAADKYRFDYSIFIGTFIGVCCVLALGLQLLKEWRLTLRS
jgi:protein SCO1/2